MYVSTERDREGETYYEACLSIDDTAIESKISYDRGEVDNIISESWPNVEVENA